MFFFLQSQGPDWEDFLGIICLLIINSTISFVEENNAGNAAAALMARLALNTKVCNVYQQKKYAREITVLLTKKNVVVACSFCVYTWVCLQVLRDEQWQELDASVLVPGDIISIRLGDIIPADARLLEGDPLKIDQAITLQHIVHAQDTSH